MQANRIDAAFAEEFVGRMSSALKALDVDALVDLATDDVIYDDMGADKAIVGKAEMATLLRPIWAAIEKMEIRPHGVFLGLDGESIAVHWHVDVQRADNDAPMEIEMIGVYTFRDGKACRWTSAFRHMDWLGHIWP